MMGRCVIVGGANINNYDFIREKLSAAERSASYPCGYGGTSGEIEPGKPVYVICQSGLRSYIATRILEGYGFEAYNFTGGFRFYDAVMNDRALIETSFACGMDQ